MPADARAVRRPFDWFIGTRTRASSGSGSSRLLVLRRHLISAMAYSCCAQIRASHPDALVIDLSRIPSHGREVAHSIRSAKASRHLPIVFVDGEPEKVKKTKTAAAGRHLHDLGTHQDRATEGDRAAGRQPGGSRSQRMGQTAVGQAGREARIQGRTARFSKGFRRHVEAAAGKGRIHRAAGAEG